MLLQNLSPEMVAEACASRFEAFARTILPESFFNPLSRFHNYLTGVVEHDQLTGRRKVAGGPRGWGKSTTITEGGTLWIVCRNKFIPLDKRYKFILIISDTASMQVQLAATGERHQGAESAGHRRPSNLIRLAPA